MNYFHQTHTSVLIMESRRLSYEPHVHKEVELVYMCRGSCKISVQGVEYEINEGDLSVVLSSAIHSYHGDRDTAAILMIFNPENYPDFKNQIAGKQTDSPIIPASTVSSTLIPTLAKRLMEEYATASDMVVFGYLSLIFGKALEHCKLSGESKQRNDTVEKILGFCTAHFKQDISLQDLSDHLHLSKSYLSHIFSDKMRIGFTEYLNTLRVNEAAEYLRKTDLSITEIAFLSGFGSIRNFNRAFSGIRGMSPVKYRAAHT